MAFLLSFLFWGADVFAQYDTNVFFFRGRQAIIDGKYSSAIENFNILASIDSTNYLTYFFRGIAKYNLGDVRGAPGSIPYLLPDITTVPSLRAGRANTRMPWPITSRR